MNCLMYVRAWARMSPSECVTLVAQISEIRQFANQHGHKIVDCVIDEVSTLKFDENPQHKHLRSYLDKHQNVDAVITSTKLASLADYAALETILEKEGKSLFLAPQQPKLRENSYIRAELPRDQHQLTPKHSKPQEEADLCDRWSDIPVERAAQAVNEAISIFMDHIYKND